MDFKKKYDEAVEKARKELQVCGSLDCDAARQLFRIFPELKESEDEMIRKSLINFYTGVMGHKITVGGFPCTKIVAWLEKQGNPRNNE